MGVCEVEEEEEEVSSSLEESEREGIVTREKNGLCSLFM